MAQFFARSKECPGDAVWYKCAKGSFQGCCSVDPCNLGTCPDEITLTSSTTTAARTTEADSTLTTIPFTFIPSTTLSISSTSSATGPAQPTPSTTNIATKASTYEGNAKLVGLIFGIAGATLLVVSLITFFVYRRRKKVNSRFGLLRWRNRPRAHRAVETNKISNHSKSQHHVHPCFRIKEHTSRESDSHASRACAVITPEPQSRSRSRSKSRIRGSSRSNLNSHAHSQSQTNSQPQSQSQPHSHSPAPTPPAKIRAPETIHPAYRCKITLTPAGPGPISTVGLSPARPLKFAHELFDTGFYRRRAELSASSCRELINLPVSQRRMREEEEEESNQDMNIRPAEPIITKDGAILTADFDGRFQVGNNTHAMSFMQYDPGSPMYHPEWTTRELKAVKSNKAGLV